MSQTEKQKFNRFFYTTQSKRMLYMPYALLSMQGVVWMCGVLLAYMFGLPDWVGGFYFVAIAVGLFFFLVYQKYFDETIRERETLWLIVKVRNYLGLEGCSEN